jgi:hypothetical protein
MYGLFFLVMRTSRAQAHIGHGNICLLLTVTILPRFLGLSSDSRHKEHNKSPYFCSIMSRSRREVVLNGEEDGRADHGRNSEVGQAMRR